MFQSLKIGRFAGIDVFIHPTFWLLPLLVLFSSGGEPGQAVLDLAVLFAAFGCIALHEFGHAFAARRYGIRTRDITLYPIGGVARLENMPDRPWPEIVVALAGPAVNVVIAAGIAAVMALDGPRLADGLSGEPGVGAFWARLLIVNVGLVLFNLIPAFPMDGGRVFRALVHCFTDRVTATEVASIVGGVFAGLIALFGLYNQQVMPVILAAFVFLTGRAELAGVRYQEEQKRAERRWQRAYARRAGIPFAIPDDGIPVVHPVEPVPVNGWEYDPVTRIWTEWRDGYPVRRVHGD